MRNMHCVLCPQYAPEKRLKQLTETATSCINVVAPTGQKYAFSINFNCADARDPEDSLRLGIKPKESRTMDVVVRAG